MPRLSLATPSITVTIGHETRLYFACVTTAPPACDSPNTLTVDDGPFSEIVVRYAADSFTHDELPGRMATRLVLVDSMQRAWQEAKYLGTHHALLPADPWLVGLNELQCRLWRRLRAAPCANGVAA